MVQTDPYKYAYYKDGSEVLFDLQKDPDELNNLSLQSSHHPQLVNMRHTMLMKLRTSADNKLECLTDW